MLKTTVARPLVFRRPSKSAAAAAPEDLHASWVYVAGIAAVLLFVGASIGAVAGWLSAVAYVLSAAASSATICATVSLGHSRAPPSRPPRRATTLRQVTEA